MLLLESILLSTLALAQDDEPFTQDVAAPEPSGCWGAPQFAVPDQGDFDVPLDIAPRFFLDGPCEQAVLVDFASADGAPVTHTVELRVHGWSSTVVVTPDAPLEPDTTYDVTITADSGSEAVLRFTTGTAATGEAPDFRIDEHLVDGWCDGREASYSSMITVMTEREGLLGYVTTDPDDPSVYQPIVISNGFVSLWVDPGVEDGAVESCVHLAAFSSDGTLGEWSDQCAAVPEVAPCRRRAFGCSRPERVDLRGDALIFLPLLGLALLRRRRQARA